MNRLLKDMGDLWIIVLDLLTYYHECCHNCQPRDSGDFVWLSREHEILEVLQDLIEGVCDANNKPVPRNIDTRMIAKAFDEHPTSCENCGSEWDSTTPIGGEWLVCRGHDTKSANHLLTKAYWTYLTHYTKPNDEMSGLEILLNIVWEKKIRASDRVIVDKRKVVAFTECSPLEIMALLEGEQHPSPAEAFRWRRSKHGIAITRSALCAAGALPVIHGDRRILDCLPEDQRFRYQKFDRSAQFSDWTFEREFRTEGDIALTNFKAGDLILIVENRREMFWTLAQRKVPPFPVMPFDYAFSTDAPYARMTRRQEEMVTSGYFPGS